MAATVVAKAFTTKPRQRGAPAQVVQATAAAPDNVQWEHERAGNPVFLRETEVPSWHLF